MKKLISFAILGVLVPPALADYGCGGYGMMSYGGGIYGLLWLIVAAFIFSDHVIYLDMF